MDSEVGFFLNDEVLLKQALRTLEIPKAIRVQLVKSKRAPPHSTIVTIKEREDDKSSYEYVIEYRKSLNSHLLRHELCHLKLHLMGLPIAEGKVASAATDLKNQVLSTLHEDYYAELLMHQKFPQSFHSVAMRGLDDDNHEVHVHDEHDEGLLAWFLQRYVLKLTVFEALGYKKESGMIAKAIEHLREESHSELYYYLSAIADLLRTLPPLDICLRQFTADEKDTIKEIIRKIDDVRSS